MFTPGEKLNLPELEEKVLTGWKSGDIFQKSLKNREGSPEFIFYEGPPTANGKPGLHHVIGRVFKDVILRYKTMRGFHVPRRAGWDTHGLPVEIAVEKELGIKSKPEIEKYGIAAFNAKAKASVWQYKGEWEQMTERIGFWLDMENPYVTYDADYVSRLWGVLKKISDRGLLYKGHKVVPWCSRCGTALASHELAQGYKKTTDTAAYVKFRLKGSPSFASSLKLRSAGAKASEGKLTNCSLLVWTTTPWTLPGNVALAVNPAHSFVAVDTDSETLILEKNAADRLSLVPVREVSVKDLIGLEYEPLFDVAPLKSEKSYRIYPAEFVMAGEGTGVVHTAVMYGEDDYALGVSLGLPQVHTVDEAGNFTDAVTGFAHLRAKNKTTEEKIVAYLTGNGRVLKTEQYEHEYPFCWRCETPVLYYATDSWFIAMSRLRAELIAANESVNWTPTHIKNGRFGEWIKEAKDWAISRARYWGTPLPIWECVPCGTYRVIGSLAELGDKAPKNEVGEIDPHRPFIDVVTLLCEQCDGEMVRVKEVMDVWFDSGAMPFAAEEFPARYPAEYVCEAIDQTRGWFYTLLAVAVASGESAPYKNVTCYSHLLDKAGKKMSKSRGNAIDPVALINKHGIDALRWHFFTSSIVREAHAFDPVAAGKEGRSFLSLIYNSYLFFETYGKKDEIGFKIKDVRSDNVLDQWIIERLRATGEVVGIALDEYCVDDAAHAIESLADDLSRWYLRRSRKRAEALPVLRAVLLETSKLVAPFVPFFADALYKSLGGQKESVHLEDWPKFDDVTVNDVVVGGMEEVRRLASAALAIRASLGIKVRQPLQALKLNKVSVLGVVPRSEWSASQLEQFLSLLKDEVNVKDVIFVDGLDGDVVLDTVLTLELKREGVYRDLVRMAQGLRQEAGCVPGDMVIFIVSASGDAESVVREMQAQFAKDVSAKEVVFGELSDYVAEATEEIGGAKVRMGIRK